MDAITILVVSIVFFLIWSWILYEIIKGATKSTKQVQFLEVQMRLLTELLKRQGVTHDEILEIIDLRKNYFTKRVQKSEG